VRNDSLAGAALLLFRGMALRRLGLAAAALEAFDRGLETTTGRPRELLDALRRERSMVWMKL